ncbi:MAG TPA: hypothetical protein VHQ41_02555 [Patescibacteria group bacterium]|nr:hypothetical protein [Patescibacteria group bacterium]
MSRVTTSGTSMVFGLGTQHVVAVCQPFTSTNTQFGDWLENRPEVLAGNIIHACWMNPNLKKNNKGDSVREYQFFRVVMPPKVKTREFECEHETV